MTIAMLITPHANARYFDSIRALSLAELSIMVQELHTPKPYYRTFGALELLCLDITPDQEADALAIFERHSSCQAVFAVEGELLRSIVLPGNLQMGNDLAAILKYKGKTNERFTALMLNVAIFSGAFAASYDQPLSVLDPMCGRCTTLFEGLRNGHNVAGIEIDKDDVREANQYIKKYLEYHKTKHSIARNSMTANGKPVGDRTVISIDDTQSMTLLRGDTVDAQAFFRENSFEVMVADLPYGIQHRSLSGKTRSQLDTVMKRALPVWQPLLKVGGTIVLAFNAHNITKPALWTMLSEAGFSPLTDDRYLHFLHWVEQAVDRDIVVATKV